MGSTSGRTGSCGLETIAKQAYLKLPKLRCNIWLLGEGVEVISGTLVAEERTT